MTEDAKRIIQAIAETETAITRATRYREDLQDHKLVAQLRAHLITLSEMLAACK